MKIGRNEMCPCGSGKKYKKCCLPQGTKPNVGNINESSAQQTGIEDDDLTDQELLMTAMFNMRKSLLNDKPHIKEYNRLRKMHSEIVNSMIDYHENGKFEQKISIDYTAQQNRGNIKKKQTFRLIESDFDMESNVSIHAFYDMLIYKPASNMNCIAEDFIKNSRYRKPEKIEFLKSMLNSKLGLFEVIDIDFDDGYAFLREIFTGIEYKITDIGLSSNNSFDDKYIYTRIITFRDISFNTGLNFIFIKSDPFIQSFIKRHKRDFQPLGEFVRFTEVYNRYSSNPNGIKVVANTY